MVTISVGDQVLTYERVAKNRSENVFEAVLVVESRTGELSNRRFELDVSSREELDPATLEGALEEWQDDHENLTIHRVIVEETNRCLFGTRLTQAGADSLEEGEEPMSPPATESDTAAADGSPLYRGGASSQATVGFGDVDVQHGEEVEYYVAGPSTSVYGTDTGTVTGVKSGTDEYYILLIETEDGTTKRVREDWLVDEE